jgi:CRP/FNR family transcriptional regulator
VLSREDRSAFAKASHTVVARKGDVIAEEGEPFSSVSSVVTGVVKLTKSMSDGRQQIVGLAFPADLVGRPFAERSGYRVEAATDVALCSFPRRQFESQLRSHPDVEHFLLQAKLDEIDSARDWMVLLGRKSAHERVATFLTLLATRASKDATGSSTPPERVSFQLPLSRAEIGDYLGMTLETVSRQLSKLRDEGIIAMPNSSTVHVPNLANLAALTGD